MLIQQLIKFSLFQGPKPHIPKDLDWMTILSKSREEAVVAIVYDAILLLPEEERPNRKILLQWSSIVATIEKDYSLHAQSCIKLQQLFGSHHPECGSYPIPVVKGLKTANHYPIPNHREFGDIDLFSGQHTDLLTTLMEESSIKVDCSDSRHTSFYFNGAHFEAHRYLFYNEANNQLFSERIQQKGINKELHALFVAAHMERHAVFFNEGLYLKDLLDWGMILQQIDYSSFLEIKKSFEIEHFADLLTNYCCKLWDIELPKNCPQYNSSTIDKFPQMFVNRQKRHPLAIVRVAQRCIKYLTHNSIYKKIYGQSMFHRFYFNNVRKALTQLLKGQKREVRH